MSAHTTITMPTRRRRRLLYVTAAVLVMAAIGAALVLAVDRGSPKAGPGTATRASATRDARAIPSIMSLTPARLAAGALGLGYALPHVQRGPTMESILASMSPETRRYTRAVMALTFRQLAAGAAGSP